MTGQAAIDGAAIAELGEEKRAKQAIKSVSWEAEKTGPASLPLLRAILSYLSPYFLCGFLVVIAFSTPLTPETAVESYS